MERMLDHPMKVYVLIKFVIYFLVLAVYVSSKNLVTHLKFLYTVRTTTKIHQHHSCISKPAKIKASKIIRYQDNLTRL